MADDGFSPREFRRERNLSNRNFNKRGSNRRRFSTESHSSAESKNVQNSSHKEDQSAESKDDIETPSTFSTTLSSASGFSSTDLKISFSSDSKTDDTLDDRSEIRTHVPNYDIMVSEEGPSTFHDQSELRTEFYDDDDNRHSAGINQSDHKKQLQPKISSSPRTSPSPHTPDPALLGVKQKLLLFENLQQREGVLLDGKAKAKTALPHQLATPTNATLGGAFLDIYPTIHRIAPPMDLTDTSIEEHSEDEVESIQDEVNEEYAAQQLQNDFGASTSKAVTKLKEEGGLSIGRVEKHSKSHDDKGDSPEKKKSLLKDKQGVLSTTVSPSTSQKSKNKDFSRNYRSRPKTEVIDVSSDPVVLEASKHSSLQSPKPKSTEPDDDEQIELRDKGFSFVRPILEELIKTEETYVENLWLGINNYGKIFERNDVPPGLRGKKYVLFGNVEQIAEFHRDEFLPMLHRNKQDLKRIFDEFQRYIENNYFYGYVLFTMNKQRSLKLCDTYKNYFKLLQTEIDDKLGINSFLVQPIQRMARYPLLLQQFINTLFKNRDYEMKPIIESCCRLEKKLRNLLTTTNESEIINDIVCTGDANEFNTFYQGKFRKVSEFHCFDHTLKRGYRSKVFIFDKCIVYTEIKGKQLIFHGRYPCEHIGIVSKTKQFTLFYEQRKQQECDFSADPPLIEQWLELITEMIKSYAEEERRKLKELHSHEFGGDHMHRKPANLSLFRDSNRFSTDSGIGNIWVVPKPEQEEAISNRTTWYALT